MVTDAGVEQVDRPEVQAVDRSWRIPQTAAEEVEVEKAAVARIRPACCGV
jgi:hypothetical protein